MAIEVAPVETKFPRQVGLGLAWVIENYSEIKYLLELKQDYFNKVWAYPYFDPESRLLPEMGLCTWWDQYPFSPLKAPHGYSLVHYEEGYMTGKNPKTGETICERTHHEFFQKIVNGRKMILCLTVPQYFYPTDIDPDVDYFEAFELDKPEYKGQGIKTMQRLARNVRREDLFTVLSDDIAVLEGFADEIQEIFGLNYQDN